MIAHPKSMYCLYMGSEIRLYLCTFGHLSDIHIPFDTNAHGITRYDAILWANAMSHRTPGTHQLHLIEEANHNLTRVRARLSNVISMPPVLTSEYRLVSFLFKHHDEIANVIAEWWELVQKKALGSSGIWKTPLRPRL